MEESGKNNKNMHCPGCGLTVDRDNNASGNIDDVFKAHMTGEGIPVHLARDAKTKRVEGVAPTATARRQQWNTHLASLPSTTTQQRNFGLPLRLVVL